MIYYCIFIELHRYLFSYKILDHHSNSIRSKPSIMASSLSMLPFHKTNLDIAYNIESNNNILDNITINTDCFNHYDQANLCEIDPDINYIGEENAMKCNQYYDINNFNMNYTNDNKLSLSTEYTKFVRSF